MHEEETMTQDEAFLQAIREAPEDDTPRLIYADWLEERGEPRAEFIRVQVELARLSPGDARRPALQVREQALWKQHGAAWTAPLQGRVRHWCFRRGFVEWIKLRAGAFLEHAAELFRLEPISWVEIRSARVYLQPLLACPYLSWLQRLDLQRNRLSDEDLVALARCRHLASLSGLLLDGNQIGDDGLRALAASPHLVNLRTLNLARNGIGDEGVTALAESWQLPRLACLNLSDNRVGDAGLGALAASPYLAHLTRLDLGVPLSQTDAGLAALASSSNLPQLTALRTGCRSLHLEGLAHLAASPLLGQLRELNLLQNGSDFRYGGGTRLAHVLSNAANARHLNKLILDFQGMGDRGLAALASSPHLAQLTTLRLLGNDIGPLGVQALAGSPYLTRLTTLGLAANQLGDQGAQILATAKNLSELTTLNLRGNGIGPAGALALLTSHRLAGVTELDLSANNLFQPNEKLRQLLQARSPRRQEHPGPVRCRLLGGEPG